MSYINYTEGLNPRLVGQVFRRTSRQTIQDAIGLNPRLVGQVFRRRD